MIPLEPTTSDAPPPKDSLALGCVLLIGVWIAGLTLLLFPAIWLAEQFALAGDQEFGSRPWLIAGLAQAAAVLLPVLLALRLTGVTRYRAALTAWALAGLFVLFALPIRLAGLGNDQPAALLQIATVALYLAFLALRRRRAGEQRPPPGARSWSPVVMAGAIVWPWVLWGALGSWLDTALNLLAAVLLGLAASRTMTPLPAGGRAASEEQTIPYALSGFIHAVTLLTMGAAFGAGGQQIILLFMLPALGWLAAHFTRPRDGWSGGRGSAALLVGLVTAGPLLFVDPEELALILNLMTRDVGYYALLATLISVAVGLLLGAIVGVVPLRATNAPGRWPLALAGLVAIALLAIYLFVGQPGFHGEQLYVILKEQADLAPTTGIEDPVERRAAVHQALIRHAGETQAELRGALDSARISYQPYYLVNALEVDAGPLARLWLESRPEVDRVLDSPLLRPLPEEPPMTTSDVLEAPSPLWSQQLIGAPQVWEQLDVRGRGIIIGQSDSGVDGEHSELREQYRGNQPGGPAGDDYNWLDPWNASASPIDLGGHGTHTLGTALGRTVGIAPDATWIGCVNLARNLGNAPRYLDCLQFLLAPFPQAGDPFHNGRPELGAHVLNNSWGCPEIEGCDATALLPAVRALRAAGVFVVASAGNSGSACGTISAPIALYDEVFTVGAIDEDGVLAPFSSRGPVTADGSGRTKPDIVAPGVNVLSAYPGGSFASNDGTSMAGPHVVGVVALMWSANPALIGDIDRTEQILIETAQPYDTETLGVPQCGEAVARPDNATGFGVVDAFAAVSRALEQNE